MLYGGLVLNSCESDLSWKINKKLIGDFSEGVIMRLIKRFWIEEIFFVVIIIDKKWNVKRGIFF